MRREPSESSSAPQTPTITDPTDEAVLLLLTIPRSGSTWLFDALRSHPAIDVSGPCRIWQTLGLNGRRYPRDLVDETGSGPIIESTPGRWDRLPAFDLPVDIGKPYQMLTPRWLIEKLHPHFFNHDVEQFLDRIRKLEETRTVRLACLVRDPTETIASFLAYKRREASWNSHIAPEQTAAHFLRIYNTLRKVAETRCDLIVDYRDLTTGFDAVLTELFDLLWPTRAATGQIDWGELVAAIRHRTRRDQRLEQSQGFLGTVPNRAESNDDLAPLLREQTLLMERCHDAYEEILGIRAV